MKLGFWSGVSFHPDLNLLVWQPRDILDEPHVDQLIRLLEQAEDKAKRPFNRYTDSSTLEAVELSFDYVFRISLYRRVTYGERPMVKSAFYVVGRATAELAITHTVVTVDSPLRVKVFLHKSAAAKWLGVSDARSEAGPLTNGIWRLATSKAVIETHQHKGDFRDW